MVLNNEHKFKRLILQDILTLKTIPDALAVMCDALMLFTAIVPMLTNVWANGGEAVALFDAVVDDDVDDSVVGVGDNLMDNLTQLPLAVTPVVSSESSPVCL